MSIRYIGSGGRLTRSDLAGKACLFRRELKAQLREERKARRNGNGPRHLRAAKKGGR
jgi:hypothetical protein